MNPPIPTSAKVSRTRAARTYAAERRARKSLLALKARYDIGEQISAAAIGFATMTLWAAEQVHREAQARYQQTLVTREAMLPILRWSVKELEAWISVHVKVGAEP